MAFIPDGWTAISEGGMTFFELQPPSKDAAVHISVYHRNPLPLRPEEAKTLLVKFMGTSPKGGLPRFVIIPDEPDEQRAFARYRARDDAGVVREWFAGCIVWPTAMLLCSCNAVPGTSALGDGERMIASIFRGTESN